MGNRAKIIKAVKANPLKFVSGFYNITELPKHANVTGHIRGAEVHDGKVYATWMHHHRNLVKSVLAQLGYIVDYRQQAPPRGRPYTRFRGFLEIDA